jgi:ketosteroid isomerase-like protein
VNGTPQETESIPLTEYCTNLPSTLITDFVNDSRAMIERISFDVLDILAGDDRAVILGSLESKLKRTGKIIKTDFAIVLTVANGEIVRFQMLEDNFAVAQAAHG